jgi:stage II sporulation protein D
MKGTGFSLYINPSESAWALAPEGCFSENLHPILYFSGACKSHPFHAFRELGKFIYLVLFFCVVITLVPAQSPAAKPPTHPPATLRIGLWTLWHDKEITIAPAPDSSATLRLCESCRATPLAHPVQIRALGARLALADNRQAASVRLAGPITLAAHGETLTLRNPVRITARNGELVLAVTLPVESYVERVVASESGASDTPESLKALAIVVRSFALHQPHGHADYDLCDSTHCQLLHWGGKPGATQKPGAPSFPFFSTERVGDQAAHAATLAIAGETLWFHSQRAEAWFHQNCGGRTASPSEVWPGNGLSRKPMPWLASRIDSYCTASGAREWSANLSLSELTSALAAQGLARPGWKSLTVARRGESGRAVTLLVDATEISAEDFRLAVGRALGWNKILSTWFEVSRQGDNFLFLGRGSGHGVGLCQAGAAAMAAAGRDSTQILAQYFPGAIAADEATGQPWQTLRGQSYTLETLDPADAVYLSPLSQALAEAESHSGLQPADLITVRAFRSTPAFRDATLSPGWVAAFTEGNWIGTQPLRTLAARKLLAALMRHEFLHALVESQAAPNTPLWLREGLVEVWSSEARPAGPAPALKLDEIDRALVHASSESQSQAAHRAAGWYAARLLERFGRAQVLDWLRTGLPASAVAALK